MTTWKESRSQSVATLRKLTGEIENLAPEHDQRPEEFKGGLWIFGIPAMALVLLVLVLVQHALYEQQSENKSSALLDRQVARLMDNAMSETSLSQKLRAPAPPAVVAAIANQSASKPKQSAKDPPKIPVPTTTPAQFVVPAGVASAHSSAGSISYAEQQLHLADQLAVAGRQRDSAAALLEALDGHAQDVQLRLAAIRAQMRIRDYAGARQLAKGGMQIASSQSDYATFERLLKTIPDR